ncbi:TetR/AcrR family transcriptional regulator [Pseudenhygromyxa sp. WMMC2535]|uniref:TetR/AcrR family transcriptional regulator n=1 Tax=Pseudenhygromyxa sp. WMMC2535 TaxID=2712867 RepID=UPI0015531395|nr:TetR/AcrR family transcriptional regulator [Pseudenhygromyxa sp. WMMC2535]NVB38699.1 TetR/AcrR family transcriptional regulator [Pseudenhygromyxa sp. WMMC2535]
MSSRDRQREKTRRRLYEAALAIFRRDGVQSCRTEDIANAAGVSRGSFYFHFPTKEHVLLARMAETEALICAKIEALPEGASLDEVLATLNAEMAAIWQHDPALLPDVAGAALRSTATAMHDQESTPLRSLLADRFGRAVARGEVAARLPAQILGDLYLANTLAGMLAWYGTPTMSLQVVLGAVTELFWGGAKAPATKAPAKPPAPPRANPRDGS